ncbi:MAG: dehydratase [Clostridiales bacterium]|jgi:acyl dehydratase|nr:dehydratase [Clostridiales bacterium]
MNKFTYDDITVGQEASFTVTITDNNMAAFRMITGDDNPLHCDFGYAVNRGYDGRVTYGMLTASYLSALAGMHLPGERSLIHEVEVKFVKPLVLRNNANLTVYGKVSEKNDMFKRIVIKVTITNDNGDKVLRGTMKVGVAE